MTRSPRVRWWLSTSAAAAAVLALCSPALRPASGSAAGRPVEALGAGGPEGHAELIADPGGGRPEPVVARSLRHDTSRPLRAIEPVAPRVTHAGDLEAGEDGEPEIPGRDEGRRIQTALLDGALQTSTPGGTMPSPSLSFKGLSNTDNASATGYTFVPPDVTGDAGGGFYVQAVNGTLAVYDATDGSRELGPVGINTLWSGFGGICQNHLDGDPIVVFDELAGRWLVSQFGLNFPDDFHECIAISTSSDPTGQWYRYDFPYQHGSAFNDYPKFGVWPDGYYMSANQFDGGSSAWAGAGATVFERSKMLLGQPARQVYMDLASLPLSSMLPADIDGNAPPAGTANVFAQIDDDDWGYAADQLELWAFHADWTAPSSSTFTKIVKLPVATFSSVICGSSACIDQPGTAQSLDDLAERLMNRLQYRNEGGVQTLVTSHAVSAGGGRAGMRWYVLRNPGGGWSVGDQGTYAPAGTDSRWMGSAAMDEAGDLAVGYAVSGPGTYPSVRYAGREAGDPSGTLMGEASGVVGGGSQTGSARYGDYSSMSVAPDGCTFWYAQEYYETTGSNLWKTRVVSFRFPSCGAPAPGAATVDGLDGFQLGSPFDVGWSAVGGQAPLIYDVRYRRATSTGTFGASVTWRTGTPDEGAPFSGQMGSTYCFSARAIGVDLQAGPWGDESCTSIPLDDDALVPLGAWSHRIAPAAYGGDYSQAAKRGAKLTKSNLRASSLALVATTCPTCGAVKVLWNGVVVSHVSLVSDATVTSVVIPVAAFDTVRTGTLNVSVSTAGRPVRIEGLGVGR
jgi:hypothetical protein